MYKFLAVTNVYAMCNVDLAILNIMFSWGFLSRLFQLQSGPLTEKWQSPLFFHFPLVCSVELMLPARISPFPWQIWENQELRFFWRGIHRSQSKYKACVHNMYIKILRKNKSYATMSDTSLHLLLKVKRGQ